MYRYSCKNCNKLVGQWNNEYKYYIGLNYCNFTESKKFKSIYFLNCRNCNKFIGIVCTKVCENCFGEDEIVGEKNLFNWFLKYKKIIPKNLNCCKICNKTDFRNQCWFFKELTFYK